MSRRPWAELGLSDVARADLLSELSSLGAEALGVLGAQLTFLMSRRALTAASNTLRRARAQLERVRVPVSESASAR